MDLLPLCTLIEMKLPVIRTADDISTAPDSLGYCVERCDLDNDTAAMNNMFTYDDPFNYGCIRAGLKLHVARNFALQYAFCEYTRPSLG